MYQEPVSLFHCFHAFCNDCIQTYMEYSKAKEPPCPVCQKPIYRSKVRSNGFLAKAAKFVASVLEQLNGVLGCNMSKPLSFQEILSLIQTTKKHLASTTCLDLPPAADFNLILKARKILITPSNQVISTLKELPPVQSVGFRDYSSKTPTSDRRANLLHKKTPTTAEELSSALTIWKDPFDDLKEPPTTNPLLQNSKTYASKLRTSLENNNSKEIIQWLQDPSNNFDRLSQTQPNLTPHSELQASFDMPSTSQIYSSEVRDKSGRLVSQINKHKAKQDKIRQKNEVIKHLSRVDLSTKTANSKRSRSLENVNPAEPCKSKKRHSLTTDKPTESNIIEQFNTEEEADLNQVLKESTHQRSDGKEATQGKPGVVTRSSRRAATTDLSGWSRIKEFKKTIRKTEKKRGKLITTGSYGNSKNSSVHRQDHIPKKSVKNKERAKPVVIKNFDTEHLINAKPYNDNKEPTIKVNNNENESNVIAKLTTKQPKNATEMELCSPEINPRELIVTDVQNSLKDEDVSDSELTQRTTSKNKKDEQSVLSQRCASSCKSRKKLFDNFDFETESEQKNDVVAPDNLDAVVQEGAKKLLDSMDDYVEPEDQDEDIFNRPTQKIKINKNKHVDSSEKTFQDRIQQKIQSLFQYTRIEIATEDIGKIKSIVKDIQQIMVDDRHEVEVQTNLDPRTSWNAETQTSLPGLSIETKQVAVQTESCSSSSGFRISSTEAFRTQPVAHVQQQTDSMACPKCDHVFVGEYKNYEFSQSLDNINFETQEAIRKKVKDSLFTTATNTDSNLGVSGQQAEQPMKQELKDSETKNKGEAKKTFKRIRTSSSDSDSDAEPQHNVKRNKYIQDNLSLYFMSELQKDVELIDVAPDQEVKEELYNEESDDVANKEFLEQVIKRHCVDQDLLNKKQLTKSQKKAEKTKDIIKECEMIIRDACTEAIQLETENIENCSLDANTKPPMSKLTLAAFDEEFPFISGKNQSKIKTSEAKTKSPPESFGKINLNCSEVLVEAPADELNIVASEFNKSFEVDDKIRSGENAECANDKITILQNITIHKNNVKSKIDVASPLNQNEAVDDNGSDRSEDMFLSDLDVVETTPQKNKALSLRNLSLFSQPQEQNVPSSNEIIMPPTEFQDPSQSDEDDKTLVGIAKLDDQENDAENKENVHSKMTGVSSLTPSLSLSQLDHNFTKAGQFHTSTQKSGVFSMKSLNLSPIRMETQNPISAAQNSKFSPLSIVKCKTPSSQRRPLSIITSTPKQKSMLNYVRPTENLQSDYCASQLSKKPCVAYTLMSKDQICEIQSLANKKQITCSNVFTSAVTHLIVNINKENCIENHTMKYVCAVASGIWVVSFDWIEQCLKCARVVPEEPFEALDVTGEPGPKKSRLARINNCKLLLEGFKIHAAPPFMSTTQAEVENVIKLLGGEVAATPDDLLQDKDKKKTYLIIAEINATQDFDFLEMWQKTIQAIAVDLEWLSRSVGQYEPLSLAPFTLYSDNSCDL